MRFRLPAAFAALMLFSAVTHVAVADDPVTKKAAERGALVAAVLPDQLPLAAREASGSLTGFDIAVAEALAKKLGQPVQFVTPGWDKILAASPKPGWDFAVASITPTPQREKHLSFPALYRMDAAVVVVRKDETKMERPRDASGKTIAVKDKTTFERYLQKNLTIDEGGVTVAYVINGARIKAVPTNSDALAAVVDKKADAAITSLAIAEAAKKDGKPIRVLSGFLYFEPVAVATRKGNPAFDKQIAEAIESLRQDGTLSDLSTKWFGIDLGTIIP
jgi:ABC-type amino acid transport/signal transduction systems, periplasmic component/domain